MDLSKISLEVDEMIRSMVSRYNGMYNPSGQITQVELDLLLDDTRKFYEKVKLLSEANLQHLKRENSAVHIHPDMRIPGHPPVENYEPKESTAKEAAQDHKEQEGHLAKEQKADSEKITQVPSAPVGELIAEALPEEVEKIQSTQTRDERTEEQYQDAKPEPGKIDSSGHADMIAGKFQSSSQLAEKLGQSIVDNSLGQNKLLHRIPNLKNAISFGDRFLFVSELFGGNDGAFDYTVSQLNDCKDKNEAQGLFESITKRKKWNAESEAFIRFYTLVQRRYI
jgi:hypothetical protein